jgi:predicted transcriptional regulator
MRRTTISLPDDMAKALAREARRRGTSVSAIAREALAERLHLRAGEVRELPFAGLGRSGARDTARRAEEILAEEWDADRGR